MLTLPFLRTAHGKLPTMEVCVIIGTRFSMGQELCCLDDEVNVYSVLNNVVPTITHTTTLFPSLHIHDGRNGMSIGMVPIYSL
jgi:hypothetical protein